MITIYSRRQRNAYISVGKLAGRHKGVWVGTKKPTWMFEDTFSLTPGEARKLANAILKELGDTA